MTKKKKLVRGQKLVRGSCYIVFFFTFTLNIVFTVICCSGKICLHIEANNFLLHYSVLYFIHHSSVKIILFICCLVVYHLFPVEYYLYKNRCLISFVPHLSLWALEQGLAYSSHSIHISWKNGSLARCSYLLWKFYTYTLMHMNYNMQFLGLSSVGLQWKIP